MRRDRLLGTGDRRSLPLQTAPKTIARNDTDIPQASLELHLTPKGDKPLLRRTGEKWEFESELVLENFVWSNLKRFFGLTPLKQQHRSNGECCDILAVIDEFHLYRLGRIFILFQSRGMPLTPAKVIHKRLPLVQKTLRHESVATTSRFLHVRPNDSSGLFLPD